MKKLYFAIVLLLITLNTAHAALPVGMYYGLKGGVSISNSSKNKGSYEIKDNTSPFITAFAGTRISKFRLEADYTYRYHMAEYRTSSGETDDISTSSLMGNIYYNLVEIPFFRLYLGGGAGYTFYNSNVVTDDNQFSYTLGGGATFTLNEFFAIDAGYRYFDMGKPKVAGHKNHFYSNDIYFGIRVGF